VADDPTKHAVEVVARQIVAEQLEGPWASAKYQGIPPELFQQVWDKIGSWVEGWRPSWESYAAAMEHLGAPIEDAAPGDGGQVYADTVRSMTDDPEILQPVADPPPIDHEAAAELCDHVGDCGHPESGWIRRVERRQHECEPPMRELVFRIPRGMSGISHPDPAPTVKGQPEPEPHREMVPAGQIGELWRCPGCRRLWRIAHACNTCDAGSRMPHRGAHRVGVMWRPATLGQRLRYAFS
jgi:hypothetical protein